MTVSEGQRVRIGGEYHWAKGATGVIMMHPANKSMTRSVQARVGLKTFVWIKFDVAQRDADGDGPYTEAEIDLDFLEDPSRAT